MNEGYIKRVLKKSRKNSTKKFLPFLEYLINWSLEIEVSSLKSIVKEAGSPDGVAIFSVDVLEGFCRKGTLASPRVSAIVSPIAELFKRAHALGVKNFVLTEDCHPKNSQEFVNFPPHCIEGSEEAKTVRDLANLPFSKEFTIIPKKSISSSIDTSLDKWLKSHRKMNAAIVVGDCTDLCLYNLALHLKLKSNTSNLKWRIIVPEECVQTYDIPVDTGLKTGIHPHDGDLLHLVFLNHLALNGVQIIHLDI